MCTLCDIDLDPPLLYVDCPVCGGEKEWEVWLGYDPRDGSPTGYVTRCDHCDDDGGVWAEPQARTLEDIENEDMDGAQHG